MISGNTLRPQVNVLHVEATWKQKPGPNIALEQLAMLHVLWNDKSSAQLT